MKLAGADASKMDGQFEMAREAGWTICFWDWSFVSEKTTEIHRDENNRLHNPNGPAVLYPDGFSVYALHGIRMKPHYVMTPGPELDPVQVLQEADVDVRRELIRKIGIEMMLTHLPHKVLDESGNYQLLRIDFPGLAQDTRYLKMLNPSIGVWHLEGCERTCNTVQQAIDWRAGDLATESWQPSQLT
jgi:hypothetical protein